MSNQIIDWIGDRYRLPKVGSDWIRNPGSNQFSHLGENGWQLKIFRNKEKGHVTSLEFYSYKLIVKGSLSYLHICGRLFRQYMVDMYAKVEQ